MNAGIELKYPAGDTVVKPLRKKTPQDVNP